MTIEEHKDTEISLLKSLIAELSESRQSIIDQDHAKYGVPREDEKDYIIATLRHTNDIIMARQTHAISHANITIADLKKQKPANWQVMVVILETIVKLASHSYTYEQVANNLNN